MSEQFVGDETPARVRVEGGHTYISAAILNYDFRYLAQLIGERDGLAVRLEREGTAYRKEIERLKHALRQILACWPDKYKIRATEIATEALFGAASQESAAPPEETPQYTYKSKPPKAPEKCIICEKPWSMGGHFCPVEQEAPSQYIPQSQPVEKPRAIEDWTVERLNSLTLPCEPSR